MTHAEQLTASPYSNFLAKCNLWTPQHIEFLRYAARREQEACGVSVPVDEFLYTAKQMGGLTHAMAEKYSGLALISASFVDLGQSFAQGALCAGEKTGAYAKDINFVEKIRDQNGKIHNDFSTVFYAPNYNEVFMTYAALYQCTVARMLDLTIFPREFSGTGIEFSAPIGVVLLGYHEGRHAAQCKYEPWTYCPNRRPAERNPDEIICISGENVGGLIERNNHAEAGYFNNARAAEASRRAETDAAMDVLFVVLELDLPCCIPHPWIPNYPMEGPVSTLKDYLKPHLHKFVS